VAHVTQTAEEALTNPGDWRNGLEPRIADEVEHVVRAFHDGSNGGKQITVVPTGGGGIDHMHAEGEILVRDNQLDRVLATLGEPSRADLEAGQPDRIQRVSAGVVLLTLAGQTRSVVDTLDLIDSRHGRGIATPNHVLTVAGYGQPNICPATEPEEVYDGIEPYPSVCLDHGGRGVLVYTADTGLLADAVSSHPWLAGVQAGDIDALPPKLPGGAQPLPPYKGHGTFVAGVLRCTAPEADVIVTNAFDSAGSALESDLVPRLEAALGQGVDIFHLSIACVSRNDLPLMAFREWLSHLREHKGSICVAAAGNSGMRRPTWPAAFSDVISVGALGGDWRGRASFSNFGGWVDVYAPGRDLVNAYATGTYTCYTAPYKNQVRNFYGMAKWSGTSFSTPIVSGLIASRMSRTGENAQQAAAALLAEARSQAIPGVGPVLLPYRRD
jgi:subtilisin family serine protease